MSAVSVERMWPLPQSDCWLHPVVVVRPSAIAGDGLFAGAPISAGTPVSRLGGHLVSRWELRRLLNAVRDAGAGYLDTITVTDDAYLVLPARAAQRQEQPQLRSKPVVGGRVHAGRPPGHLLQAARRPADNPDGDETFAVYASPADHPFCFGLLT